MAEKKITHNGKPNNDLSFALVDSLVAYDPDTGEVRWKHRPDADPWWNGRHAGRLTKTKDKDGYNVIVINGRRYTLHRIAFLLMTARWPTDDIDHINGTRDDNRWVNLREATRAQNLWNMRLKASNTSGFKGVSWSKVMNKWLAQIRTPGTNRMLGYFATPEEAADAYRKAATELRGEFARFE